VGTIQIKDVPDELHEALRQRAAREGVDVRTYVLDLLRRDLALPTQREWLAELRRQPDAPLLAPSVEPLREARGDRDDATGVDGDRS
jgi:plasmid stability protein